MPAGDLRFLKRTLHDWDDGRCVAILRDCRAALRPGGRVLFEAAGLRLSRVVPTPSVLSIVEGVPAGA
ncbi:methyltransferase [Streptomyces huiliensis]|uniref:methyltransferase n=1 Tax=Streptomyces huiliensis TaxID=2876027 RepID=UPI0027E072B1|nr:methyltransferase [Streptomyces huiliensis]